MKELHLPKIEALPKLLVSPGRFGKVAVAEVVQFPLPELAKIYDFPQD